MGVVPLLLNILHISYWASQVVLVVKNPPANAGDIGDRGSILGSRSCHACRRAQRPAPVFLPEESHGQRILVGYSPEDHRVGLD